MSVTTATFAPAARHASACATIFCGSFSAFVIKYVTPAALSALAKSGASNCTQRTDDFVSGSRTQTWTLAAFLPAFAPAPVATSAVTAPTSRSRTIDLLEILFTASLLTVAWMTAFEGAGIWTALRYTRRISRSTLPHRGLYVKGADDNSRAAVRWFRLAAREDLTRDLGIR